MKKIFILFIFNLLLSLNLFAQNNPPVTVTLEKGQSLLDCIAHNKLFQIQHLIIIGDLDNTDLTVLNEMSGANLSGDPTKGVLSILDLSEANLNVDMTKYSFRGNRLTSITLPKSFNRHNTATFSCPNLVEIIVPEENEYYENYDKILKMINRKIRSEYEIKTFLTKNEVSKPDIDKIINKLKDINLINDELFAEAFTNDKINLTLEGPYKIKKELEDHNIPNEYIENALSNFTQDLIDLKLEKIINKKIKANTKDTDYIFKQKTFIYLSNLGYSREDISNHLDKVKLNNNLEKEMEKIYNKLKTKYEGNILYHKLKQKLYSKGFTVEEINNFIEKTVH